MKKGILYTVLFTLVVSFLFVFFLSFANEITKDITEKNEELALQRAVLIAFNIPFTANDDVSALYKETIHSVKKEDTHLFTCEHDNKTEYGILFSGQALWGQVTGILVVNEQVTRIIGIEFIQHNETPGLGGRIDEKKYKDQFRGEMLNRNGIIASTRNGTYDYNHENSSVDGITGATRTSESIITIVNTELSRLRTLLGEAK